MEGLDTVEPRVYELVADGVGDRRCLPPGVRVPQHADPTGSMDQRDRFEWTQRVFLHVGPAPRADQLVGERILQRGDDPGLDESLGHVGPDDVAAPGDLPDSLERDRVAELLEPANHAFATAESIVPKPL